MMPLEQVTDPTPELGVPNPDCRHGRPDEPGFYVEVLLCRRCGAGVATADRFLAKVAPEVWQQRP